MDDLNGFVLLVGGAYDFGERLSLRLEGRAVPVTFSGDSDDSGSTELGVGFGFRF